MAEVSAELVLAVVALVAAAVGVGLAWSARRRLAALDRMVAGGSGAELAASLARHEDQLMELRSDLLVVHDNTQLLRRLAKDPLSHIGLVRYDAFTDLSGAMSFSLALLDEQGDGVVLSSIIGRTDSRVYAKSVIGGRVSASMTAEEATAISRAVAQERDPVEVRSGGWRDTAEATT